MEAAMYKALSGAVVEMRRLETASQDLANVNTAGYKGQRLAFSEVLAKRVGAGGPARRICCRRRPTHQSPPGRH